MGRYLGLLLILLATGRATPVEAYPTPVDFGGTLLRWDIGPDDPPITYGIEAEDELDEAFFGPAVHDAAALWTDVPTSYFAFAPAAEGNTPQVTVHLQSAISGGSYSSGYAIFDETDDDGAPRHCSIYVQVSNGTYEGVAKTLLHEFGHCVGLGHSLIPEAIMSYRLRENAFALDLDDEAAVTRLYPADGSEPALPPGCATGAHHDRARGTVWLLLLVPLGLVCVRRARSRDGDAL